jgi:methylated-DNA-[protein]-cysteine S-methyltransferase
MAGFVLDYVVFDSPLGWIVVGAGTEGIRMAAFLGAQQPGGGLAESAIRDEYPEALPRPAEGQGFAAEARQYIFDYLTRGRPIPEIPLDVRKGTDFDRRVWRAISEIPFGQTRSYGQVALAAGRPSAARAAGRACGRNPVPIIVPCHRVVGSGGKLGGYSGGLEIKRALLDLEKRSRGAPMQ